MLVPHRERPRRHPALACGDPQPVTPRQPVPMAWGWGHRQTGQTGAARDEALPAPGAPETGRGAGGVPASWALWQEETARAQPSRRPCGAGPSPAPGALPGERDGGCQAKPHVRAGSSVDASAIPPPPRAARGYTRSSYFFPTRPRTARCRKAPSSEAEPPPPGQPAPGSWGARARPSPPRGVCCC